MDVVPNKINRQKGDRGSKRNFFNYVISSLFVTQMILFYLITYIIKDISILIYKT